MDARAYPRLQGHLSPERPDDLKVVVHDGGPRVDGGLPEAVWVNVTGCEGDVFTGRVLNEPQKLRSVQQGQQVRFVMTRGRGREIPLLVRDKYLRERSDWIIDECQQCGFPELFDAPSDLMRINLEGRLPPDALAKTFTTPCPLCGGSRSVGHKAEAFEKYPWKADVTESWNRPDYWQEYYERLAEERDRRRQQAIILRSVDNLIRMLRQAGALPCSSPQALLDAGCGIAAVPALLARWGFQVTATDSCPLAIDLAAQLVLTDEHLACCVPTWGEWKDMPPVSVGPPARALHRLRSLAASGGSVSYKKGDWFAWNLAPGSFSVVHCRNSLRHSIKPYWRRSLRQFYELLKPGGVLLLENQNALWMRDEVKDLAAECGFVPLAAGAGREPHSRYLLDSWPTG